MASPSAAPARPLLLRIAALYHHRYQQGPAASDSSVNVELSTFCDHHHHHRHHQQQQKQQQRTRASSSPPVALSSPASEEPSSRLRSYTIASSLSSSASSSSSRQKQSEKVWREYWNQKIKTGVWAVAFAAVVAVGSLTGAQLKTDKQKEEAIKEFRATSPAQQIAALQNQRAHLVDQKTALQRKLDLFRDRVRERHEEQATKTK